MHIFPCFSNNLYKIFFSASSSIKITILYCFISSILSEKYLLIFSFNSLSLAFAFFPSFLKIPEFLTNTSFFS